MKKYLLYFVLYNSFLNGQNLILNSSFSEVWPQIDTNAWYKINFENKSNVINWYIPTYFNNKTKSEEIASYYTSRNIKHHIKNKIFTNSEEMFNNNLGFIRIYTKYCMNGVIQQKLPELPRGLYCFKFKYKKYQLQNIKGDELNFSFSKTNLQEFFKGNCLNVSDSLISFTFNDSINNCFDIPWQQVCATIELKGNEQYFTLGSLKHNKNKSEPQNKFYIDDIELIPLDNMGNCECQKTNKEIILDSPIAFPINKQIDSDALGVYVPRNPLLIDHGILFTPETIKKLNEIISFMLVNPTLKIKFIEHDRFNSKLPYKPLVYNNYRRYMNFYNISDERIIAEWGFQKDLKDDRYYGINADFIKVSFMFYN